MIRIYATERALALRGTVPELAIIPFQQFQGIGYSTWPFSTTQNHQTQLMRHPSFDVLC